MALKDALVQIEQLTRALAQNLDTVRANSLIVQDTKSRWDHLLDLVNQINEKEENVAS